MEPVLTANEVAAMLRCSARHVCNLYDRGELEGFRDGRRRKIYEPSVHAYIERKRNRAAVPPAETTTKSSPRERRRPGPRIQPFKHLKLSWLEDA